ncbi:hypothetical protein NDN08_001215 [Rhodosorus marinus]|uniref:Mitochondrial import inner membrane translocase subunit n=1 Tax=Rhodosorus marinus TaxID=101924 RepID=A0AAV8UTU6_9RHOD|nr:hypothetical protein NDN08_001215 [Rhodosorus marinus]
MMVRRTICIDRDLLTILTSLGSSSGRGAFVMAMPNQYELMKQEITFYADLFNKMADQCFKKCVPRYTDSELNTGEKVCVDRCVGKYLDVSLPLLAESDIFELILSISRIARTSKTSVSILKPALPFDQ